MKHTPGPWKVVQREGEVEVRGSDGNYICFCYLFPQPTEANAQLIASAPELLEACRELIEAKRIADTTPELLLSSHHNKTDECVEIMERYEKSFEQVEQAIAKAEGI